MIKCHFCTAEVADTAAAAEAGWIPSFWLGDREMHRPVCPACTSPRLEPAPDDGEYVVAEHNAYADEAESPERGSAWLQAVALWKVAADMCLDDRRHQQYLRAAERCRQVVNDCRPLPIGTKVAFDIEGGLAVGTGAVRASEYDDGWLYHIDVTEGDRADDHRDDQGELWVCEHEVTPKVEG